MKIVAIILIALSLMACERGERPPSAYNGTQLPETRSLIQKGLGSLAYRAVEHLLNFGSKRFDKKGTILVTSLVNVDNLRSSSTFGRLLGDQATNRLVQLGYVVKELRLGDSLVVRQKTGELILSRDLRKISKRHSAQAIIAGTYAIGVTTVYVNMRLISPTTEQIVSAVDFVAPLDHDMKMLLASPR